MCCGVMEDKKHAECCKLRKLLEMKEININDIVLKYDFGINWIDLRRKELELYALADTTTYDLIPIESHIILGLHTGDIPPSSTKFNFTLHFHDRTRMFTVKSYSVHFFTKTPEEEGDGVWGFNTLYDWKKYVNDIHQFSWKLNLTPIDIAKATTAQVKISIEKVVGAIRVPCKYESIFTGIDLGKYLLSSKLADFKICVGGQTFPCHKVILAARSPVFARMFEHSTKETVEGCLELEDVRGEIVEQVLQFIYTGTCDVLERGDNIEQLLHIHRLAHLYMIEELMLRCDLITCGVTEENASGLWEEAQLFQLGGIKQAVTDFCFAKRELILIEDHPLRHLAKKCFTHLRCTESADCSLCRE